MKKNSPNIYSKFTEQLLLEEHTWLITGVAGFIGSNLLEKLLKLNQKVVGLDNFSTGSNLNLDDVRNSVSEEQWTKFNFLEGDIRNLEDCSRACKNVKYVLHQAALGSVPRSVSNPIATNEVNISGFLNMLVASRDSKVKRVVYAASSSTYGDHASLPKVEDRIGRPLSPYAVTKLVNELYAEVFFKVYGLEAIGLRYFNVFGPRQNPKGPYAAVIPTWIDKMINGEDILINGDGETSRDFCFVENVVQANILSALNQNLDPVNEVFNVAVGQKNSLQQLFFLLKDILGDNSINYSKEPKFQEFRVGDVRHSLADISKSKKLLGYSPSHTLELGLKMLVPWWISNSSKFHIGKAQ